MKDCHPVVEVAGVVGVVDAPPQAAADVETMMANAEMSKARESAPVRVMPLVNRAYAAARNPAAPTA